MADTEPPVPANHPLHAYLAEVKKRAGSDLHLSPGNPARMRKDGLLIDLQPDPLPATTIASWIATLMDRETLAEWEREHDVDFAHTSPSGRIRGSAFTERDGPGATFRLIPDRIPHPDELGMPAIMRSIAQLRDGMVLITGPTGSGKSTTLAAIIGQIAREEPLHIITIEDPIEFVYPKRTDRATAEIQATVTQREVGPHTRSFARALKGALRQDPDVIVVGEMRDWETMQLAMTAAETGHLVFGTLHTNSAIQAVTRIVDMAPTDRHGQVRGQLSDSLRVVVAQQLLPRPAGGRYAVHEVMRVDEAIGQQIRKGTTNQIADRMHSSSVMQTLEATLAAAVAAGHITAQTAREHANDVKALELAFDNQTAPVAATPTTTAPAW